MITGLVRVTLGKTPDSSASPAQPCPDRAGVSGVNPSVGHTVADQARERCGLQGSPGL
jgi:hypothetical protein